MATVNNILTSLKGHLKFVFGGVFYMNSIFKVQNSPAIATRIVQMFNVMCLNLILNGNLDERLIKWLICRA